MKQKVANQSIYRTYLFRYYLYKLNQIAAYISSHTTLAMSVLKK